MTYQDEKARLAALTAEYQRLRKVLDELDAQADAVDGQLVEIERKLPDPRPSGNDPPSDMP